MRREDTKLHPSFHTIKVEIFTGINCTFKGFMQYFSVCYAMLPIKMRGICVFNAYSLINLGIISFFYTKL